MSQITDFLRQQEMFAGLTEPELAGLATQFQLQKFKLGDIIVKQAEVSNTFYLIYSGFVNVLRGNLDKKEQEIFISTLGAGDCFGEAALFHDVKRTANIKAFDDCETLSINKDIFVQYLKENPVAANKILYQILKNLFFRLEQTSSELQFERKGSVTQKTLDKILS